MEAHRLNHEWLLTYRKFNELSRRLKAQNKQSYNEFLNSSGDFCKYEKQSKSGQGLMVLSHISDKKIIGPNPERPEKRI